MKHHSKARLNKTVRLFILLAVFAFSTALTQEIKQNITDALDAGDTTRAIQLLNEEIEQDPSYEYNYFALGMIYKNRGNLQRAEEQFQLAIEKKSRFYEGYYELGMVRLELGKVDEAEENFQFGLRKSKDLKAFFHNGQALVYLVRDDYSNADTEIRKAIVIDSTNAEFHINLGKVYVRQGVYPLAASEFEKALALDTLSLDIYFDWAEACLEMKDYGCALEKLSVVLQKDSSHAPAWMRAGGIYYKAARSSRNVAEVKELYGKTIAAYEKYIELSQAEPDSANGRAFYEAGMAYLKMRYYREAQEYFDKVLSIPVTPKDIYFNYATAWQGVARLEQSEGAKAEDIVAYDSALVHYERHIEYVREMQQQGEFQSSVSDGELYREMGECYEAKKDRFNTISYYKKSLEYDSTQQRLLYGVAVAYNYVQDYRNALLYYMKRIALGIDDRFWSIYYNAATSALYLAEKGPGALEEEEELGLEGEEEVSEAPVDDPFAEIDFVDLAVEYLERITNDHWAYVGDEQRLEKNKPLMIKILGTLGSAYLFQKKDCTSGINYYEQVLEFDENNCEAIQSLGFAYFGEGLCSTNYTRALSYFNRALSCWTTKGDAKCQHVDLMLWIAQAYHFRAVDKSEDKDKEGSQADFARADEWYQEVLKCDPGNQPAKDGQRQVQWEH